MSVDYIYKRSPIISFYNKIFSSLKIYENNFGVNIVLKDLNFPVLPNTGKGILSSILNLHKTIQSKYMYC